MFQTWRYQGREQTQHLSGNEQVTLLKSLWQFYKYYFFFLFKSWKNRYGWSVCCLASHRWQMMELRVGVRTKPWVLFFTLLLFYFLLCIMFRMHVSFFFIFKSLAIIVDYDLWLKHKFELSFFKKMLFIFYRDNWPYS